MAEPALQDEADIDEGPLFQRRRVKMDDEIDITPMIDCTFQLLIFFLVCSVPDPQKAVALAQAAHGVAVNPAQAVIVTVAEGPGRTAQVYLGERDGELLPDSHEAQREALLQYFQAGVSDGKTMVIIKSEAGAKMAETYRVASVVGEVEGLELKLAVSDAQEEDE
jgi:biopolymer transport protein ExbD